MIAGQRDLSSRARGRNRAEEQAQEQAQQLLHGRLRCCSRAQCLYGVDQTMLLLLLLQVDEVSEGRAAVPRVKINCPNSTHTACCTIALTVPLPASLSRRCGIAVPAARGPEINCCGTCPDAVWGSLSANAPMPQSFERPGIIRISFIEFDPCFSTYIQIPRLQESFFVLISTDNNAVPPHSSTFPFTFVRTLTTNMEVHVLLTMLFS